MYKVLVVDDEEMICRGIKSLIEYVNIPEVGKVITAFSGHEAARIARAEKPDIVITDIKMPGLSGLGLIKTLSDYDKHIRFIVLSGYDDFHYVKESFKMGVKDYLLKPASTKELREVMLKVIGDIEEERKLIRVQQERTYHYHKTILQNNLNRLFVKPYMDEKTIKEILADIKVNLPYEYFCIGIFEFIQEPSELSIDIELQHILNSDNLSIIKPGGITIYNFFNYKGNLVVLFNFHNNWNYEQGLKPLLYDLAQVLYQKKNYKFFIAISEPKQGLEGLYFAYCEAMESLRYKILFCPGKIIEYRDIRTRTKKCTLSEADIREFSKGIYEFDRKELSNFVDGIFNEDALKDRSIDNIKGLYETLVDIIDDTTKDFGDRHDVSEEFHNFNSLIDIRIHIKERIKKSLELLKDQWANKSMGETVRRYVENNFHKEVSMSIVANMVGLSYSYFSRAFKEETGMNFSEYVMEVRMEKARQMLDDPTTKVHEVSRKTGYRNPKHFTRAFKNYYGISPKEYQNGFWVEKYIKK